MKVSVPRSKMLGAAAFAATLSACAVGPDPIEPDGHAVGDKDAAVAETGGADERDLGAPGMGDTSAGEAGAGLCGNHEGYPPFLSVRTIGPTGGAAYDGPAVVERSTSTELVLAFSPQAATSLPLHAVIHQDNLPMFPPGAKVWLYKSSAGDPSSHPFSAPAPWTIALRDKQGGHLLLGAGMQPDGAALIPFNPHAGGDCTTPYTDDCASGTAVYSSLDVQGDSIVTIADNETRTVRVGGIDYDVTVMARDITTTKVHCADYFTYAFFAMNVRAKDPAALIAALTVGPQIACARGNDVVESGIASFYDVAVGTSYDGKAFYTQRGSTLGLDCFQFSVVGVSGATARDKPTVEFCAPPGLFPEPTVGQEFWATLSSFDIAALRGPNRGPLLLADVYAAAPFDAMTSARIAQVLGVPAEARPACAYAQSDQTKSPISLWEVVLGATSPGLVKTDAHTVVPIAGRDYDAWMSASDAQLYFSLVEKR